MKAKEKEKQINRTIALLGNPNVGKSSVFNEITGMNQHTGNWTGKTVTNAQGYFTYNNKKCVLVDLPGTYSLIHHSKEEETASDFICFEQNDCICVVCDATSMEKSLNLVLQVKEITDNVFVCVNLIDEAQKKNIFIDFNKLSELLNCDVIPVCAKKKTGIDDLKKKAATYNNKSDATNVYYNEETEKAVLLICDYLKDKTDTRLKLRWIALKILENNPDTIKKLSHFLNLDLTNDEQILKIRSNYVYNEDHIVSSLINTAHFIAKKSVIQDYEKSSHKDRRIDKVINSRLFGIPIMIISFLFIFWLTITGANYPSELLSKIFFGFENILLDFFIKLKFSQLFCDIVVKGMYRTVAWVISVMLPPMAIFFPLFTLLEDIGFLPRIAFNLDRCFKKCSACGKQALCMAMGFGCNAAGVVGARIIDSKRERLIAVITNSLVPCNGRFSTLIAVISMFFVVSANKKSNSLVSSLILTSAIIFCFLITLLCSKILSMTVLKGEPSSFTLELPPYRIPKVGEVIVRSIFDRTLYVLARAIEVALPAGLIISLFSNIHINNVSILKYFCGFLDPLGRIMGLDGCILGAFILGFPANEIIFPIAIMAYLNNGSLIPTTQFSNLHSVLIQNGWTVTTAVCFIIFFLMHWPCSTTCLTIKKETGSLKWTFISMLMPTVIGVSLCILVNLVSVLVHAYI